MTTLIKPHPFAKHTAEQIEASLICIAMESGNVGRARKLIKEQGVFGDEKIPLRSTLARWPETYSERYAEIRAEIVPKLKARLADVHTDLAQRLAELESQTIDDLNANLDELSAKDKANLLRNAAVAGGIHQDKAAVLRGEASSIVGHRQLPEIMRALAAKGVQVIEAEVVEETTLPQSDQSSDTDSPS